MKRVIPLYDFFTFAGKSSLDFKAVISGNGTYRTPERHIETVLVPGRNGDLTISDDRYNTVDQTYDGFIVDDFIDNYSGLANWLMSHRGNHRLEDSYHPDEFRMARFVGPIEPDTVMDEAGRFTLTFKCQPQRYLKIGERAIAVPAQSSKGYRNPTLMDARPKILVTGTGTFYINTYEVTVTSNPGTTVIDSELQDCYLDDFSATNRNAYVTMPDGFPVMHGGEHEQITAGAGVSLTVFPRWWRI